MDLAVRNTVKSGFHRFTGYGNSASTGRIFSPRNRLCLFKRASRMFCSELSHNDFDTVGCTKPNIGTSNIVIVTFKEGFPVFYLNLITPMLRNSLPTRASIPAAVATNLYFVRFLPLFVKEEWTQGHTPYNSLKS